LKDKKAISKTLRALSYIPTPLSGYAQDASLLASALGYGRRPSRRMSRRRPSRRMSRRRSSRRQPLSNRRIRIGY